MTKPVQQAIAALQAGGIEVRFIGGCVRDHLAGFPIRDFDLATPEPPQKVIACANAIGIKIIYAGSVGLAHGTVTLLVERQEIEVTSLRRDVATDGRHAVVSFGGNWLQDAARRDFTFNALSMSLTGEIYDPFDGIADLRAGRVRFIGDPVQRITEDRLRILRLFRFQAWYGRTPLDHAALNACTAAAHELHSLSGERCWREIRYLLTAPDPTAAIEEMIRSKVLAGLFPCRQNTVLLSGLLRIDQLTKQKPDPLRRLASLIPDNSTLIQNDISQIIADRLRFSCREANRLRKMRDLSGPDVGITVSLADHRIACYRLGVKAVQDRLLLAWAENITEDKQGLQTAAWQERLVLTTFWRRKKLPINGDDLLSFGIESGPMIGQILKRIEALWIESHFTANRAVCLRWMADQITAISLTDR